MPTFNPAQEANNSNATNNRLDYFKLNAGDRKIVRFINMDDANNWGYEYGHNISNLDSLKSSDAKWKFVTAKCLGGDSCPFCNHNMQKSGKKGVTTLAIIPMIEYDSIGEPKAVVWKRSSQFYKQLYALVTEYSPLSNHLFVVTRTGSGLDTTYSILPAPAERYPNAQYPVDLNLFAGKSFDPNDYMLTPTAEQAVNIITIGHFDQLQSNQVQTTPTYNQPVQTAVPQASVFQPQPVPPVVPQPTAVVAPQNVVPPVQPVQPQVIPPTQPVAWNQPVTTAAPTQPAYSVDQSWMNISSELADELPFH